MKQNRLFITVLFACLFISSWGCRSSGNKLAKLKPSETVKLRNIYTDNMIFQREKPMVFRGTGTPGQKITVAISKSSASVQVRPDGNWELSLPPQAAGGPYTISVSGQKKLILKNILIGDIWLCSGQSNMQFALKSTENAKTVIASADHPRIRLFTVKLARSQFVPKKDVVGKWLVCTPASAKSFSAVGYYFGRKLNKDIKVPIGLIDSSWGGTMIEPWISRVGFEGNKKFKNILTMIDKAKTPKGKIRKNNALIKWVEAVEKKFGLGEKTTRSWRAVELDNKSWKKMSLPASFESNGVNIDGVVWFRKELNLPASMAGKNLLLSLGKIDDCDISYFNGHKVGSTGPDVKGHWAKQRRYTVPGKYVKAGGNIIAVRVQDNFSSGGMLGPGSKMFAQSGEKSISLSGDWYYKVEYAIDYKNFPRRPSPEIDKNSRQFPTTLFNAMISPLTYFPIKGAIWYQGESNAGAPKKYEHLMKLLIKNWRNAWNEADMPFFLVQLAAFYRHTPGKAMPKDFFERMKPQNHNWSLLRESQLKTLEIPNTGIAVSIDIGDPVDIHPRNKKDVGERLALAAEKIAYGKDICYSGPMYKKFKREGNKIKIYFDHLGGGLKAKNGKLKQFAIAGKDKKFVWAKAKISGDNIIVWSGKVKFPVAVRYAWSIYPEGCNLYNNAGLPASPFRTDNW